MTLNSVFLRSLRFVFPTQNNRRQYRADRRNGVTTPVFREIEVVEERCLLSAVGGSQDLDNETLLDGDTAVLKSAGSSLNRYPISGNAGGTRFLNPLTSIPVLNSRPGAPVSIYLDFNGHSETDPSWNGGNTVTTPVFDVDGDLTTFSDEELRRMDELWYRVSEDFAPFEVNITTVEPAQINDFESLRISIGGDGGWLGTTGVVGVAQLNGFSSPTLSNTVFAFSAVDTDVKHIANTISHESGHAFGLEHQSSFDAGGNLTAVYRPGTTVVGPIMGQSDISLRDIWDTGPSELGATVIQDDLATLTRAGNQTFRYRTDDHGNTNGAATSVTVSTPAVSAKGIIERNGDIDVFRFETNSGDISFSVNGLNLAAVYNVAGLNPGTNLDAVLRLFDGAGTLIGQSDPTDSLSASLSVTVSSGIYYVSVSGTSEYGSLGQYTLTGTVIPLPSTPTMVAPFGTLTQMVPLFEWTPGANADYYQLQVDNLTTNQPGYYTRDVTGVSHLATTQFVQGDYQARVRAVATNGEVSGWSEFAAFTIDVPAPTKPVVNRPTGDITDSFPDFGWTGDANSTTYTLWVNNATTGVRVIYRTSYSGTSYVHFNPLPDGIYRAWVRAFNAIGESSVWSEPVDFKIKAPLAAAPKITAPAAVSSNNNPRIAWNAVEAAAKYDLWVDNLTTGKSQYIRQQNISYLTPYFDATALPQGTFRAWVRTANGNNQFSVWSDPYTFTIDILPPSKPSMLGPGGVNGNQVVTTTNPTFTWTAADRAARYDLWVNNMTTGQAQIIRQTNITDTRYVALSNLPQGVYRAWVRGINSADEVGEWSNAWSFTLDEPTPTLPVITAPLANVAGVVIDTNPTFVWTNNLNAPFYEFQLDDRTINKNNIIHVNSIQGTSYTIPQNQTLTEHTYVAWVRARNSSGETSNWSAPFQVRIDIPNPETPVIIGPTGTSKDTTPTFQWTHNAGSQRYEILVRDLERSETIVLQVTSFSLNPTGDISFYTLPNSQALRPGTYRFWIRAFNSLGTPSSWSSAQAFVISASLDLKDLKIVEPARLQAAEEFYADTESRTEYASDAAESAIAPVVPDVASHVLASESGDTMPDSLIEEVMKSLSDPASTASAMLSGAVSVDSDVEPGTRKTTTAVAMLVLAMMPVRQKRRED